MYVFLISSSLEYKSFCSFLASIIICFVYKPYFEFALIIRIPVSRRQRYCLFAEYANFPTKGLHIPQNLTNFAR